MKICPRCNTPNVAEARFCKKCGTSLSGVSDGRESVHEGPRQQSEIHEGPQPQPKPQPEIHEEPQPHKAGPSKKSVYDSINEFVDDSTAHVDVHLSDLYVNVFKHHTTEEAEDIFICGTSKTTPPLADVSSSWPKPWLYSRVFLMMFIAFTLLRIGVTLFGNSNLLPGMIIIGAFTVPVSVIIFFMEVNAYRNISFYNVLRIFLVGGCASLIVALTLFAFIEPSDEMDVWSAMMTGFIEEVGKLVIVYFFIKQTKRCNFILSGMLIGAAVGAGFAAFESAGYAIHTGNLEELLDNIYLRGLLTPGGHVVWAAITGAAIMLVKSNKDLRTSMLFEGRFWKVFILPVLLHALWDWSALDFMGYLKPIALIVIAWAIAIALINRGLIEVKKYQYNISTK
jgi:protease PrsW